MATIQRMKMISKSKSNNLVKFLRFKSNKKQLCKESSNQKPRNRFG